MIFIIVVQSEDSLGKIIYTLHEETERKKFVCKEKMIAGVYLALSPVIVAVRIGNTLYETNTSFTEDPWFQYVKNGSEEGLMVIMSIVFFTLVWLLSKHYKEELKSSWKYLIFFYIFELTLTTMTLIGHDKSLLTHYVVKKMMFALGAYPIQ